MDAPGHLGFDQGAEVLVADGALVLLVAAAVETVTHGLVLQVAFAALVADRAVERMIDEQEFHHPTAHFANFRGVGFDHHAVADRHRARRDWFRRVFHVDQAHAAVTGDG